MSPPRARDDGRVPPYDLDAERSLLGAMLLTRDAIAAAAETGIAAADFIGGHYGDVYDAIRKLHAAEEPVDPVTVADALRHTGALDKLGGPGALVSMQVACPATSSAGRYARIVVEKARLRRLIVAAGEIAEIGYRHHDDVDTAVDGRPGAPGRADESREHRQPRPAGPRRLPRCRRDRARLGRPWPPWSEATASSSPDRRGRGSRRCCASSSSRPAPASARSPSTRWSRCGCSSSTWRTAAGRCAGSYGRCASAPASASLPGRSTPRSGPKASTCCGPRMRPGCARSSCRPERRLLVIGPLYKMASGSPIDEEPARQTSRVLDELRERQGITLVIEAHCPYPSRPGGARPIRPYGASLWSRWPEFGLHLTATGELAHWRGQRDERAWPPALRRGVLRA